MLILRFANEYQRFGLKIWDFFCHWRRRKIVVLCLEIKAVGKKLDTFAATRVGALFTFCGHKYKNVYDIGISQDCGFAFYPLSIEFSVKN